jgi:hypothetical protein
VRFSFFGVLFWTALLCVSPGQPILEETADQLVWAALKWRLSIIAMLIRFAAPNVTVQLTSAAAG